MILHRAEEFRVMATTESMEYRRPVPAYAIRPCFAASLNVNRLQAQNVAAIVFDMCKQSRALDCMRSNGLATHLTCGSWMEAGTMLEVSMQLCMASLRMKGPSFLAPAMTLRKSLARTAPTQVVTTYHCASLGV